MQIDGNSEDSQNEDATSPNATADSNQYLEARKALRSIKNHTKHKSQLTRFALKIRGKTLEQNDTSPIMATAAYDGNFAKVISIVASQTNDQHRKRVINEARCRSSPPAAAGRGTSNTAAGVFLQLGRPDKQQRNWFDLTPLATAAMQGHCNVVEYLLRQGADPTLRGSPSDDEDYNALEPAKRGVWLAQEAIEAVLFPGKDDFFQQRRSLANSENISNDSLLSSPQSALSYAQELVHKREQCGLCVALLESVVPYWPRAPYYSSHFRTRTYTNKSTDMTALRASLDAITMDRAGGYTDSTRAAWNASLVSRLAAKLAPSFETIDTTLEEDIKSNSDVLIETSNKRPKRAKPSKGTRRGRRYSDSLCLRPLSQMELESIHNDAKSFQQVLS